MESSHRIDPLSVTPTIGRQTPDNAFGSVMARAMGETVRRGSAVVGGMLSGAPVLSAAVSSASNVVAAVTPEASSGLVSLGATRRTTAAATLPAQSSGMGAAGGRSEGFEMLEAQRLLQENGQSFNMQYLQLQESMQKESRDFNTVSNILKVRHDSAKAAINNIR